MGFIKSYSVGDMSEQFFKYCLEYGYSSANCERLTTDNVYDMLYACWIRRTKQKKFTLDAYEFECNVGVELEQKAEQVAKLLWRPSGYKEFKVHHPERTINAPLYGDRIVEQWLTERYIIPFWKDKLLQNNLACQEDKGPHLAIELIKAALNACYEKYGTDFWFFQGDMQGYYDNISQTYVKKINLGMNPYGYFLLNNIIDSWEESECYAKMNNPRQKYGFPKGNLPSQWIGITTLNEFDHLMAENPDCEEYFRYMDDFLAFYPTKYLCRERKDFTENYLKKNQMGIRLHPNKTAYAPITRGFNFCGWHYCLRKDGSVEVKVRQDRKKLKKKQLASKQKAYKAGKVTWNEVTNSMQSTFAHYKHGDTKNLRKYMSKRYRFCKDKKY